MVFYLFFLLLLKYEQQGNPFLFIFARKKDLSLSAVLDGEVKIKKIKKTRTTRCDDDDAETTTTTTAKYCASLFV